MRRILLTMIAVCSLMTAYAQSGTFTLNGYIPQHDYDGIYIYLIRNDAVNRACNQKIDSTKIKDGRYHFELNTTSGTPYVASLELPPKDNHFEYGLPTVYCIVEPGNIQIDYTDLGMKISGGNINKHYEDLLISKERAIHKQTNEMMKQRDSIESKRTFTETEEQNYNNRISSFYSDLKPYTIQFISDNIKNDVGAFFFFYHPKEYYGEEYAKLAAQIKPEYFARMEAKEKAEQEAIAYEELSRRMTKAGNPYRDIISKTVDGKSAKLSDYVKSGKITLVDFWASWCVPCMMELKDIKALYAKYHSKGLNIVSVSVDTKKDAWLAAIKKQQLPWTQLSDLKGWQGKATKDYAISAIPYIILIDQQGKIAIQNLHSNLLENCIKKLLNIK